MYEEKKKYLDESIEKLRKEGDSMNGIFAGAVAAAVIMFLLFAIPDIASQWSKGFPEKIQLLEEDVRSLKATYRSAYKVEATCTTEEERKANPKLTERQLLDDKICSRVISLRTFKGKLDLYTTISEMRLSQEKGELLIKLVPALILAVFAGSLLNYRHLKTKEVELIKKRVELLADGASPSTPVTTDKPKV